MGRRLKKLSALGAAAVLAVFIFLEPLLLLAGLPGTLGDFAEWRDKWLPVLTVNHVAYVLIALNLGLFLYFWLEDRAVQFLINSATHKNPDRVRATPRFVKIRQQYSADEGYLAPIAKIQGGSRQLLKFCDKAAKGDVEAYYMAAYLFEEINKVSRQYAGSSRSWAATIKEQRKHGRNSRCSQRTAKLDLTFHIQSPAGTARKTRPRTSRG